MLHHTFFCSRQAELSVFLPSSHITETRHIAITPFLLWEIFHTNLITPGKGIVTHCTRDLRKVLLTSLANQYCRVILEKPSTLIDAHSNNRTCIAEGHINSEFPANRIVCHHIPCRNRNASKDIRIVKFLFIRYSDVRFVSKSS